MMASVPTLSDVHELCRAVSEEEDSEQMMVLVDELLYLLDVRLQAPAFD